MTAWAYSGSATAKVLAASRSNQIFFEGHNAQKRGMKLEHCPYPEQHGGHGLWCDGWHKAQQEQE